MPVRGVCLKDNGTYATLLPSLVIRMQGSLTQDD